MDSKLLRLTPKSSKVNPRRMSLCYAESPTHSSCKHRSFLGIHSHETMMASVDRTSVLGTSSPPGLSAHAETTLPEAKLVLLLAMRISLYY